MQEPVQAGGEALLAEWEEAHQAEPILPIQNKLFLTVGGLAAAALLVVMGLWQHQFSYYLGAFTALVALFALVSQGKKSTKPSRITLTSTRLIVGKTEYPLADFAGFWMEHDGGNLVINVETKKRKLIPISFFYSSDNRQEAEQLLTQVLPEIAPPEHHIADNINRYFRP